MCCRYYIPDEGCTSGEFRGIFDEIGALNGNVKLKRGEIFPSDTVPVIANNREMVARPFAMKWGYKNFDGKLIINARSETAVTKPIFSGSMAQHRCLIPATHYFEWEKRDRDRTKYIIRAQNSSILYMAGIYRIESGVPVFVILTRDAAPAIASIHERMPVILPPSELTNWLDLQENANDVLGAAMMDVEYSAA